MCLGHWVCTVTSSWYRDILLLKKSMLCGFRQSPGSLLPLLLALLALSCSLMEISLRSLQNNEIHSTIYVNSLVQDTSACGVFFVFFYNCTSLTFKCLKGHFRPNIFLQLVLNVSWIRTILSSILDLPILFSDICKKLIIFHISIVIVFNIYLEGFTVLPFFCWKRSFWMGDWHHSY